ncbi:hypothetical protein LINGRAHAP2_LOCUS15472 [Linum grandiflorum]
MSAEFWVLRDNGTKLQNNTVYYRHGLLSIHMPAYSDSVIKGVSTVMVSYSNWRANNGLPQGHP